ncbi:MAG: hypothetical protein CSA29_01160 [Desulfobacterales bacterium]|nr:MAG: hypothetical protein CSA29_01160 [Desulfobacterales bacterium]
METEKAALIEIRIKHIPKLIQELISATIPEDYQSLRPCAFSPEDFLQPFLSPKELKHLNRFKALKKQIEWICGRYTAKTLAQDCLMPAHELDQINIQYMVQGAPYLTAFPNHCLSLSHSGIYTAAALCTIPDTVMGIDIEAIAPRPAPSFMELAFTHAEIENMGPVALDAAPKKDPALFKAWTLKEAYLKYIRLGFNESLHQVEVLNGKIYHHGKVQPLDCRTWELNNGYLLSCVFPPNTQINVVE